MKRSLIRVISVVLAVLLMVSGFAGCSKNEPEPETTEPTTEAPELTTEEQLPENVNPLTGKADLSDSAIGARPIAIMIENHPDARPQWGISTPDVVVEGCVEGGITRMMWIYADANNLPEKIGPVRSARHDYVEIAKGMNAIFVHWGGSDENGFTLAYPTIKNLGVNNIDGLKQGAYFYRDTSRSTSLEHRGCTSGDKIIKAIADMGYTTKQTNSSLMPYKATQNTDGIDTTTSCSEITANFSTGYVHTFKYNSSDNKYYNYLNNKIMTDGNNGASMAVENVIILYVPVTTLNTGKGHKEWNLEATNGEGYYAYGGKVVEISWSKAGKSEPLKLTTKDGKELETNQGQVWMGLVPAANKSLTTIA